MLQGRAYHDRQKQKRDRPRPQPEEQGKAAADFSEHHEIREETGVTDALEKCDGAGDREGENLEQEPMGHEHDAKADAQQKRSIWGGASVDHWKPPIKLMLCHMRSLG